MKFTAPECLEIIKAPVNGVYLQAAKLHEQRLLMHVEPLQDSGAASMAVGSFLNWVKSLLPDDKFVRFSQLMRFPLETVDLSKSIFDELSKFYDTPDKFSRFQFKSPEFEQDFLSYLEDALNDENFWQEKGFEALKTAINSFVVVDLPASQSTFRPEPYYYLLSVASVVDVQINQQTGALEYIAFYQGNNDEIVFIDEIAYRRFIKPDSGEWALAQNGEAVHSIWQAEEYLPGKYNYGELISGLGYVPACSFFEHSIKGSRRINKNGPLTPSLGKLDKLLFKIISQDYFEMYGSYPIVVSYKSKCKYRDQDGNECNSGFITYEGQQFDHVTGQSQNCNLQKPCPVCATSNLLGPGSHWTTEPPSMKDEADLMENPVKFIEPGTDLLEFGVDKIEALKREIFIDTVGFDNIPTKEAINEKQQDAQFEGRKAKLNRIREQFDATKKFALETTARLRYGRYYVSGSVFGGQEYFLQTAEDIAVQYENAKKRGLPSYEVARIRESYTETRFKGNPAEKERAYILSHLLPYPDKTEGELRAFGLDAKEPSKFLLKADFMTFVRRFERENGNIVEFGSLIDFNVKLQVIEERLLQYVEERIGKMTKPEPTTVPAA